MRTNARWWWKVIQPISFSSALKSVPTLINIFHHKLYTVINAAVKRRRSEKSFMFWWHFASKKARFLFGCDFNYERARMGRWIESIILSKLQFPLRRQHQNDSKWNFYSVSFPPAVHWWVWDFMACKNRKIDIFTLGGDCFGSGIARRFFWGNLASNKELLKHVTRWQLGWHKTCWLCLHRMTVT